MWYKRAMAAEPEGVVDALAYYGEWLLNHDREAEVLQIISPSEHIEYLHFLRGVALERLGRTEAARAEYLPYIAYSASDPAPSQYRVPASKAQEGIVFEDQIGPLGVVCYGYELLADVIQCEAGGESEGGQRAVGWTVRTRVFKGTLPSCVYVDNSGDSTSCKYERVITQASQFVEDCGTPPGPTASHVRYDVYNGYAPDPTTGYCPSGSYQGDACNGSVHCSGSSGSGASDQGPMRFYSVLWSASCPTGGGYACLSSKDKVCGDRADDPGNRTPGDMDHCFYNRP